MDRRKNGIIREAGRGSNNEWIGWLHAAGIGPCTLGLNVRTRRRDERRTRRRRRWMRRRSPGAFRQSALRAGETRISDVCVRNETRPKSLSRGCASVGLITGTQRHRSGSPRRPAPAVAIRSRRCCLACRPAGSNRCSRPNRIAARKGPARGTDFARRSGLAIGCRVLPSPLRTQTGAGQRLGEDGPSASPVAASRTCRAGCPWGTACGACFSLPVFQLRLEAKADRPAQEESTLWQTARALGARARKTQLRRRPQNSAPATQITTTKTSGPTKVTIPANT